MTTSNSLPRLSAVLVLGLALGGGATALLLRPKAQAEAPAPPKAEPKVQRWTCPMHPDYVSERPGDCPSCGMALVPVDAGTEEHGAHDPGLPGLATVTIDPHRQQLLGLRTAKVVMAPVGGEWRAPARVAVDETGVRKVHVKVEGYVERLHADFLGKAVRRGEPLLSLYSPDLLGAQREYLLALRTQKALAQSPDLEGRGRDLLESARRRLSLWDVPEAALKRLDEGGEPTRTVTLLAPLSGIVTAKNVVEGARVSPGDALLEVTDLSQVWVVAEVQESELARVRVGQGASVTVQAFPGLELPARVAFLDPVLDPKTRTVKVRLTVPNPKGELRPEMFGEAVFRESSRKVLTVPADAVLDAGTRKVVFVALGEGRFAPREVRTGAAGPDRVEVLEGLESGEEVVVKAAFLVDSESRLKGALAALGKDRGKDKDPHAGHGR